MTRNAALPALLLAALLPAACSESTSGPDGQSATPSRIYTTVVPDVQNVNDAHVISVALDGTDRRELVDPAVLGSAPVNESMVYRFLEGGNTVSIWKAATTGEQRMKLSVQTPVSLGGILSPNGRYVLYSAGNELPFNEDLRLLDLNTGSDVLISDSYSRETIPAFSPDSRQIAFYETWTETDESGNLSLRDLLVVSNVDGSDNRVLDYDAETSSDGFGTVAWSSDGTRIAFMENSSGYDTDVAVINIDGSNRLVLTVGNGEEDFMPHWSPDGREVAYANASGDIYVVDMQGNSRNLSNTPQGGTYDLYPLWSPDGKYLLYTAVDEEYLVGELYRINTTTGERVKIADNAYKGFWGN